MTKSERPAQEFIQNSFSPLVAVLCSPKVDDVVTKNNLTFTELLQPFTSLERDGQFREPGGTVCIVKNWKLLMRNINWKPLPPTEARQQLNNAAICSFHDNTVTLEIEGRKIDIPQSTPWFDAWRETYLEVQFPSDHEFTKHFLACIIVATANEDNIIETFNGLNQQCALLQNVTPPKLPKWFNSDILKSYLLLHDVSIVTKEKADSAFDLLKNSFGSNNCFMLSINSKSTMDPSLPVDFWAKYVAKINQNIDVSLSTNIPQEHQALTISSDEVSLACPEAFHPLTTVDDVYDNANSLQAHSFSGSSESVSVSGKTFDFSTEIHGSALNANDVEALKRFIQDFAFKALLPHLEKQINQLSEGVATRKGVSRSLISATKRWFGTGKSGNAAVNNSIIYSNDCPELQLRRLGDLWFLCGQWQRAFDIYHAAKREFYADGAWLCYAGALEMAALSAFMSGDANRKTQAYMEESIVTYLNTCRMVQFAVRATLLSTLCLSTVGLHGEAAKQLIRMTSEDSDLRSAMLLEQAALCFLSGPGSKAMSRKYAFHMVLAGHRFSKAGQKKHAYRCYKHAYQVYCDSGWRLATDHVEFALGRLAGALRRAGDAVGWLRRPLAAHSLQAAPQQDTFLREYMLAHNQWRESSEEFKECLPVLPLPLLDTAATTVLCVGPTPLSSPGRVPATSLNLNEDQNSLSQCWTKMEEMLLQVAQNGVPMIFKPTVDLYTAKTDSRPIVSQGEPIQIAVTLRNPLKIVLMLKNVELLWEFHLESEDNDEAHPEVLNNEPVLAAGKTLDTNVICGQKIKTVRLDGNSTKVLNFTITPLKVGKLNIQGVAYTLINVGESGNDSSPENLSIHGKLDCLSDVSGKRTKVKVIPHSPCLQMTFSETSSEVFSGEIRSIDVEFRNVGPVDMKRLFVAVSHPDCVSLVTPNTTKVEFKQLYDERYREPFPYPDERCARTAFWRETAARHTRLAAEAVPRAAHTRATLLLRPSLHAPALYLLAYYETGNPERPYRLLRHTFKFKVIEAVEMSLVPRRSLENSQGLLAENMNLVVEIKNVTDESHEQLKIEVLEVSLLSRQWKLNDTSRELCKNDVLAAHERMHLIFRARRILTKCPEDMIEYSCFKVAPGKVDSDVNITELPYSEFLTDFKPFFIDTLDSIVPKNNNSSGLIQSMFVIRWKVYNEIKTQVALGQHCVWLDCFKKTDLNNSKVALPISPALHFDEFENKAYLKNTKAKKQNCVVFRLEHSNHISHNFKDNKLCLVPITLNIVNCYGIPVCVFIETSREQHTDASLLGWAGSLNSDDSNLNKLGLSMDLEMYESRRVEMRAICASPGTYTLGSNFSMTALRKCDLQPVSQNIDNSSLLVVQSVC